MISSRLSSSNSHPELFKKSVGTNKDKILEHQLVILDEKKEKKEKKDDLPVEDVGLPLSREPTRISSGEISRELSLSSEEESEEEGVGDGDGDSSWKGKGKSVCLSSEMLLSEIESFEEEEEIISGPEKVEEEESEVIPAEGEVIPDEVEKELVHNEVVLVPIPVDTEVEEKEMIIDKVEEEEVNESVVIEYPKEVSSYSYCVFSNRIESARMEHLERFFEVLGKCRRKIVLRRTVELSKRSAEENWGRIRSELKNSSFERQLRKSFRRMRTVNRKAFEIMFQRCRTTRILHRWKEKEEKYKGWGKTNALIDVGKRKMYRTMFVKRRIEHDQRYVCEMKVRVAHRLLEEKNIELKESLFVQRMKKDRSLVVFELFERVGAEFVKRKIFEEVIRRISFEKLYDDSCQLEYVKNDDVKISVCAELVRNYKNELERRQIDEKLRLGTDKMISALLRARESELKQMELSSKNGKLNNERIEQMKKNVKSEMQYRLVDELVRVFELKERNMVIKESRESARKNQYIFGVFAAVKDEQRRRLMDQEVQIRFGIETKMDRDEKENILESRILLTDSRRVNKLYTLGFRKEHKLRKFEEDQRLLVSNTTPKRYADEISEGSPLKAQESIGRSLRRTLIHRKMIKNSHTVDGNKILNDYVINMSFIVANEEKIIRETIETEYEPEKCLYRFSGKILEKYKHIVYNDIAVMKRKRKSKLTKLEVQKLEDRREAEKLLKKEMGENYCEDALNSYMISKKKEFERVRRNKAEERRKELQRKIEEGRGIAPDEDNQYKAMYHAIISFFKRRREERMKEDADEYVKQIEREGKEQSKIEKAKNHHKIALKVLIVGLFIPFVLLYNLFAFGDSPNKLAQRYAWISLGYLLVVISLVCVGGGTLAYVLALGIIQALTAQD